MADAEREDSYYHPSGVPVTPQARRLGYEFPVYVSDRVWREICVTTGLPSRLEASLDQRITRLMQYCYDGMMKKLTQTDDFLFYYFKVWYWDRERPNAKKQRRARLGARLFLDPSTGGPWLYIFRPGVDSIDALKQGEPPQDEPSFEEDESE